MADEKDTPTYGLLAINHAYNQGTISFREWLELSRLWAVKVIEQYERQEQERWERRTG